MSISAVESRISQILAMQQQLSDPTALLSSQNSSATSGGAASTGGASATPASFSDALSSALASGTADAIGGDSSTDGTGDEYTDPTMDSSLMSSNTSSELSALLAGSGGTAGTSSTSGVAGTSGVVSGLAGVTSGTSADAPGGEGGGAQVQAMVNEANSLIGKPYIYGGGHSGWGEQAGYDCSGFVSAVLHAGGYLSEPQTTQTLPGQPGIESGPGQYVTIYDRNTGPTNNEHVIIEIDGQFYESGGEAGSWGGGGGVEKIATPSQAYLSSFTTILHPAGL
jgi:cell wall-associated NlpC family hydrolase